MPDTNPFDQAARYFARMDPAGVLAWVLGTRPGEFQFRRWIDTRTLPFPGSPERVGDLVAHLERIEPPGQPWLVPVEVQIAPDPLMFGRLLEYLGRLWQAEKPSTERGDRFCLAAAVVNLTGIGLASRDFDGVRPARGPASGWSSGMRPTSPPPRSWPGLPAGQCPRRFWLSSR